MYAGKEYFQCLTTALGHKILVCEFDAIVDHIQLRGLQMVNSVS